jgi:threonine aldolase
MSICLSKGLGAPIGSLLVGSNDVIAKARRWRKVLGGGMRQVGILAAAAKIALTDNVAKLAQDHQNAKYLAEQLSAISEFTINKEHVETNMVFVTIDDSIDVVKLAQLLKQQNILITPSKKLRLVTHLDISQDNIDSFVQCINDVLPLCKL